ncbi:MAG: hypothetical protein KDC44_05000, partial [Phaeodactylibacter sp.]|nr:hypothetical protein [Phaeodactylibacter sp.]
MNYQNGAAVPSIGRSIAMKTLFQLLFLFAWLLAFPCKAQYHFDHARRISTAEGLPSDVVNAFAEDRYGFVWIGTGKGLCRYDGSQVFQVKPSAPDSVFLPSESIRSLFCKGDSLFIGTEKGLSILDLKSWHFKNVDPSRSRPDLDQNIRDRFFVRDIYEDRQGDLWLAPAFEGFVRWDTRADRLDYFPLTYSEA